MSTNEIKQAELMARLQVEFEEANPNRKRELALLDLAWAKADGWTYKWDLAIDEENRTCCLAGAVMLRRYGRYVHYSSFNNPTHRAFYELSRWALRGLGRNGMSDSNEMRRRAYV